ncbi:MAG: DNA starvation/stationary phase protection protein [Acidimicrobiia bacterium]|nr:DNA starvation/stationary phase protection protein [Acidimicrobiia bacterium]NNF08914.1 DNA starvation/stationary phase protection protein [Acidimicrobiia bacterium]NNL14069.1 DNA starvation/stationary phase protection protein [Acidimicrobiia bacterium]NNL99007.1 DNA starvation/stationary phase protection protein [Acidimicrobiia bacterium]RZV43183.1 MAG: DNA starvation/stationary phase protection protein [Acidimicrobiia bacterium]
MDIGTGLTESHRKNVAAELSHLLADSYTLYLKSHNYHWNVTGPMFQALHLMFEEHYTELALAVDEIAERIRALGHPAPATYSQFARLSSVTEEEELPDAMGMVGNLVEAHETVIATARTSLAAAEAGNDAASADLATRRIDVHEKTAWMLRSLLA